MSEQKPGGPFAPAKERNSIMKNVRSNVRCDARGLGAVVSALAAVLVMEPAAVQAASVPAITISGGGVGEFLDPNPCDGFKEEGPFGESNFAVSAKIYQDGSVSGTFMCQVKGCVVIVQGKFTDVLGIDRADGPGEQDIVFLSGEASFIDLSQAVGGPGLVFADENGNPYIFQFCIELREGPGSGNQGVPAGTPVSRFFYTDEVVLLGGPACLGLDDGFDQEEIRKGHIQIDFKSSIADIPFNRVEDCPVTPLPCE